MYKNFLYLSLLMLASCILVSCKYKNYYFNDTYQIEKRWGKNQDILLHINNYQISGTVICNFYKMKKIHLQFFFQSIDHCKCCRLVLTDYIGLKHAEINIFQDGSFFISENIKNYYSFYDFRILIKDLIKEHTLLKNFQEWMIGLPGTDTRFTLNTNGFLEKVNYRYHEKDFVILYKNYCNDTIPILPSIIEINYDSNFSLNMKLYKWSVQ